MKGIKKITAVTGVVYHIGHYITFSRLSVWWGRACNLYSGFQREANGNTIRNGRLEDAKLESALWFSGPPCTHSASGSYVRPTQPMGTKRYDI